MENNAKVNDNILDNKEQNTITIKGYNFSSVIIIIVVVIIFFFYKALYEN